MQPRSTARLIPAMVYASTCWMMSSSPSGSGGWLLVMANQPLSRHGGYRLVGNIARVAHTVRHDRRPAILRGPEDGGPRCEWDAPPRLKPYARRDRNGTPQSRI